MSLFKSTNRDKNAESGIPHDGGFGYKNLRKYEEHRPNTRATDATTIPVDQTSPPIDAAPAPRGDDRDVMSDAALEEPRLEHNTEGVDPQMNRSGAGGGGGFISQSHADRLSREGELRRQQQLDQHGHIGSAEEMNAMGFDSLPPSGTNHTTTSRTEVGTDGANSESNDVPSAEVEEPSELKKQATATYQRAVECGALPFYDQSGGIQTGRRASQA